MAIYLAHFRRFGRTVYAIGGYEGRNEQSARLMGLPVNATKVLVYTLNGFCSALAGVALGVFVLSGHGSYAYGAELDVIASVVMGGTMLTGGEGYVFGTLFGVLIFGVTQTLIQFNGMLSSWWTRIVIGALTLIFIGVQSLLAARKGRRRREEAVEPLAAGLRRRRVLVYGGGGAVLVIALAAAAVSLFPQSQAGEAGGRTPTPRSAACELKPYRQDQATALASDGAVVVYERNGGPRCIDELYAIYPDGRIVGDDGADTMEKRVSPAEVETLLASIRDYRWFTDEMYNTWHTPCGQCYGYYLTVADNGRAKAVKGVDGGTDAPADYWQVISLVKGIVPRFEAAP